MKKKFLSLLYLFPLLIFLLLFPKLFSIFHFQDFLNLQNGNLITKYSIGGVTYYVSERPSELSSDMSAFSKELPYGKLLIREKHGFARLNLKNAKCYTELKLLFMTKKSNKSTISIQEIVAIINKYYNFENGND